MTKQKSNTVNTSAIFYCMLKTTEIEKLKSGEF